MYTKTDVIQAAVAIATDRGEGLDSLTVEHGDGMTIVAFTPRLVITFHVGGAASHADEATYEFLSINGIAKAAYHLTD